MNKRILFVGVLVLIPFGLWLAFGYFGIHKAFVDDEVEEDGPSFDSGAETKSNNSPADEDEKKDATSTKVEPEVVTAFSGEFSGSSRYSVSGTVNVLTDGSQSFLRFEDGFESTNGPDLKVYLRAEDGRFVNLGQLKGNVGSQNYEIDSSVDLSEYSTVEIWCERFSVGFGSAQLN